MTSRRPPTPDQAARERAATAVDTSCFVEAGAGSGKTTLLVDRLLHLVATGHPVDAIAAVTFTRKAAAELRERFELRLEEAAREHEDADVRARCAVAFEERARGFVGTIHAFCGRLLREHALTAGLPPDFTELDEEETAILREEFWREHVARGGDSPALAAVERLGIAPARLHAAFAAMTRHHDADVVAPPAPAPPHERIRDALVALVQRGFALHAALGVDDADDLRRTLDVLWRAWRRHDAWADAALFAQDVAVLLPAKRRKVTLKRWTASRAEWPRVKDYAADVEAFVAVDLRAWLDAWTTACYAPVVEALREAVAAFATRRRRAGQVGFDDLLTLAVRLLRDHPDVRRRLGARWRALLVDEFQDTDPLQAELCFLLASDPAEGDDWRTVTPRPGSLFVVGDPKQSIYRFRRADIATYRLVEAKLAAAGERLALTANFRSVPAIGRVVEAAFAATFDGRVDDVDPVQAAYAPLLAQRESSPGATALALYEVAPGGRATKDDVLADDAAMVSSWIAARIAAGERRAGDFMILAPGRDALASHAKALAERRIPVRVDGAEPGLDEVVQELRVLVTALADPDHPVAVLAALEGIAGGCTPADLHAAVRAGVAWRISAPPAPSHTGPVTEALARLHRWWRAARSLPPAAVLDLLLDESHLLAWAAGGPLGDQRAGLLVHVVDVVRESVAERTHLGAILDALDAVTDDELPDAPLRAGEVDVVRVMNLHKAKGLEAPVVVLAAPVPRKTVRARGVEAAVWRDEGGHACAAIAVHDDTGRLVASPADWEARATREIERLEAEADRLRYVAVTRARDELLVATRPPDVQADRDKAFFWAPIVEALRALDAPVLALPRTAPPGRPVVAGTTEALSARIDAAIAARARAAREGRRRTTVTKAVRATAAEHEVTGAPPVAPVGSREDARSATDERAAAPPTAPPFVEGRRWGHAVHRAIEGAMRGRRDEALAAWCDAVVHHELPAVDRDTRAAWRDRLVAIAVRCADDPRVRDERVRLPELPVAGVTTIDGDDTLLEGVIDLLVPQADGGWLVLDWKTDGGALDADAERAARYREQVAHYAALAARHTASRVDADVVRVHADP